MGRFKSIYSCIILITVCFVFFSYGCGKPPTQEITDAEVALSAAKSAGAEIYAAKEYESAESKLEKARKELEGYHYINARQCALESKDEALVAKKLAEEGKLKLRKQASDAIQDAKKALMEAENAGAKKHDPEGYKNVEALIGEADMAYGGEKYPIAISKAEEAQNRARRLELAAKRAAEIADVKKPPELPKLISTPKTFDIHIVQKGECLWIISEYENVYSNPFEWPLIYKANHNQIKDPDMIFPNQNLKIPRDLDPKDVDAAIYHAKHRGPWSLFDGK